jgi:enamidase
MARSVQTVKLPGHENRAEAVQFSKWAKKYGMRVMIHCGGTSLPDVPTTNAAGIIEVQPDVLAHLNGGPTALSPDDIDKLMRNTTWTIDLVRFGNPKALDQIAKGVVELGAHRRVILGTCFISSRTWPRLPASRPRRQFARRPATPLESTICDRRY